MAFLDFLKSLRESRGGLMQPSSGMGAPFQIQRPMGQQQFAPELGAQLAARQPVGAPGLAAGVEGALAKSPSPYAAGLATIGNGLQNYDQEMDQQHQADMAQQQQMHQQAMQRMNMGRTQQNPIMQVGQLPNQAQQAQSRFGDRFAGQRRGGMFSRYRGY